MAPPADPSPTPEPSSSSFRGFLRHLKSRFASRIHPPQPTSASAPEWICYRHFPWNFSEILCESCYAQRPTSNPAELRWGRERIRMDSMFHERSLMGLIFGTLGRLAERPLLGVRVFDASLLEGACNLPDQIMDSYLWWSYADVAEEALRLSAVLTGHFCCAPGDAVVLLARCTREYVVALFALLHARLLAVPLHHSFSSAEMATVLHHVRPRVCLVAPEFDAPAFHQALDAVSPPLPHDQLSLLIWDTMALPGLAPAQHVRVPVFSPDGSIPSSVSFPFPRWSYAKLVGVGAHQHQKTSADPAAFCWPQLLARYDGDAESDILPSTLVGIMFTSGSTGQPKGVLLANQSMVDESLHVRVGPEQLTSFAYRPFSHMTQWREALQTVISGGRIGFASCFDSSQGSQHTLFEELPLVSPTYFQAMPRLWDVLKARFDAEVLTNLPADPTLEQLHALRGDFSRRTFGDRLHAVGFGGAYTHPALVKWIESMYPICQEGYGISEIGAIASGGVILSSVAYKLRSVPSLGYLTTDLPFPRGELLVKTRRLQQQCATHYLGSDQPLLDEEGYFATGDIVEIMPGDRVRVLDRCKNTYKLSQSEFVAPEMLESLLTVACPWIDSIYLHCHNASFLTAVAVPHPVNFRAFLASHDAIASTLDQLWPPEATEFPAGLVDHPSILQAVLSGLIDTLRRSNRPAYEMPRLCVLHPDGFTIENQLMVISGKKNRPALMRHFGPIFNILSPETTTTTTLSSSKSSTITSSSSFPVRPLTADEVAQQGLSSIEAIVSKVFAEIAPGHAENVATLNLLTIGIDSLGLGQFHAMLQRHFDRALVPSMKNIMLQPTVSGVAGLIFSPHASAENTTNQSFERDLEALSRLSLPTPEDPSLKEHPSTVLVTGATGFLGRYLLFHLLTQPFPGLCKVVCLVRAKNDAEAYQRVVSSLAESSLHTPLLFKVELIVLAADLRLDAFGLEPTRYLDIASTVHAVYHLASRVNHMLPYELLRDDNVMAMLKIIQFCSTIQMKWLHYASTLGVQASKQNILLSSSGYLSTKYVAEQYVLKVFQDTKLQGTIHRFGSIGFDTLTGYYNRSDFICQVAQVLIHNPFPPPHSAYDQGQSYFPLPVDFAATQMVSLARAIETKRLDGIFLFHLTGQVAVSWASLLEITRTCGLVSWGDEENALLIQQWTERMMQDCPLLAFKMEHQLASPSQILPNRSHFLDPSTKHAFESLNIPFQVNITPDHLFQFISCLSRS